MFNITLPTPLIRRTEKNRHSKTTESGHESIWEFKELNAMLLYQNWSAHEACESTLEHVAAHQ